jgi:hypothetical protein
VQQSIVEAYPEAEISVYIVWINRLESDSKETTNHAVKVFGKDPRIIHFYDPRQRIGRAVAKSLGVTEDESVWDVYLFYKPGKEWVGLPPVPDEYMHQLTDSAWADPAHYHTGDDLVDRLRDVMNSILNK